MSGARQVLEASPVRLSRPSASGDIDDPRVVFLLDLARALHAYGTPSDRLEALLSALGEHLGLPVQLFLTPTAIFASFGVPPRQRTLLVTPRQGETDLGRMGELDELVQDVAEERVSPAEGSERVSAIIAAPNRYPWALRVLAQASLCSAVALILGGGVNESAVAALVGVSVAILEILSVRSEPLSRLMLPAGAFVAAAGSALGTLYDPGLATTVVGVAGVIMLLPGLTLTIAMNEIATGHLVSGTARLSRALLAFLLLGFGAALGGKLAGLIPGVGPGARVTPLAVEWPLYVGIGASILALGILLSARVRDFGWIASASLLAYGLGAMGAALIGPEVGAGVATLGLGLVGNAFARFRNRPAALLITPGILLLVPGSLGFRSVSSFLEDNVLVAVATAFDVALVAVALVSGLLVANLALPPRKAL